MSAEMPPEQINPYASPREVSAEAEDTLRRQTPFGLTEPIHAAGTLTPEELRSEVRRSFGLGSKQSWGWILLLLGLSVLLAWQTTKPWILILAAVCVSFGALIWRSYRGRVQQGIADWCRERKEFWFSETSVTIGATTFQKTLPWEAFARCTVSDTLLSLHSIWSDALCVPRSFVALASDWQRLTALVRHKLPETPTAQPSESEKPLPAWAESDGPLRGQGHLGYEDALALLHRSRERARFWQEAVLALGPLPVPLLVAAATTGPHTADWIAFLVAAALFGWLLFLAPRQSLRKQARAQQGLCGLLLVMVSEEGVTLRAAFLDVRSHWSHFAGFHLLPNHLFLCVPSEGELNLPRSFFSEADWPKVVALVERKLPRI